MARAPDGSLDVSPAPAPGGTASLPGCSHLERPPSHRDHRVPCRQLDVAGTLTTTEGARNLAATQLGPRGADVIGPGWGKELFLWSAFADALGALPTPPAWPTWSPAE
jgi:hypothetical protein